MVPEIPSRYHSGKEYKVAIMYIPTDRHQRFGNWMGYRYYYKQVRETQLAS